MDFVWDVLLIGGLHTLLVHIVDKNFNGFMIIREEN
jgi:hypothetical protein